MGYITSATTQYLDLHMTERGRRFLLQGSLADQIVKFALGDTDKDYRNYLNLDSGYVPDVTGNHNNCIFGVNDGYEIRNKITYVEGGTSLSNQQLMSKMMISYIDPDTNTPVWGSRVTTNLYLHDWFTALRVAAFSEIGSHNWSNLTKTDFTGYFDTIFQPSGKAWSLNIGGLFDAMENKGRGIGLKISDKFFTQEKNSYNPSNNEIKLVGETSRLFPIFFGGAYVTSQNQEVTEKGPQRGLRRKATTIYSPFALTNNTFKNIKNQAFVGSGEMTLSLGTYMDYGYMFGQLIENVTYYPSYGFYNEVGGMYNIFDVQNPSFNSRFIQGKGRSLNTLVPMGRIVLPRDPNTNAYFPLQTNQINSNNTTNFKSESGTAVGRNLTDNTAPISTLSKFLSGTAMYTIKNEARTYDKVFSPSKPFGELREPKTGLSLLIEHTIDFFEALTVDPTTSNFITTSGTGLQKEYNIPFKFEITNSDRPEVAAAVLVVNVNFSLKALFENFTYLQPTATSPAQILVWDSSKTQNKFFGAGASVLDYTINPLASTTTGGYAIFNSSSIT